MNPLAPWDEPDVSSKVIRMKDSFFTGAPIYRKNTKIADDFVVCVEKTVYKQQGKFDDQALFLDKNQINSKLIFTGMPNFTH